MNSYHQVNPDDSIYRVALKGQVIRSSGKVDSCEFITQNAQVRHLLSQADRVAKAPALCLSSERARAKRRYLSVCTNAVHGAGRRLSGSNVLRYLKVCSRASFLVMKKGPLPAQSANLWVASSRRLGGTETLQVDVRVIAATNVDFQEEVRRGNFREDLFCRLNVIELKLPPLVEYFIRKLDAGKGGRMMRNLRRTGKGSGRRDVLLSGISSVRH